MAVMANLVSLKMHQVTEVAACLQALAKRHRLEQGGEKNPCQQVSFFAYVSCRSNLRSSWPRLLQAFGAHNANIALT